MFKNWSAICQVQNAWLRMLVATCDNPDTLRALSQGFPELFSETETVIKMPYTAFLSLCIPEEADAPSVMMSPILEHLSIPFLKWGDQSGDEELGVLPHEWRIPITDAMGDSREGYDPMIHPEPTILEWKGISFLLVEVCEFREGHLNEEGWVIVAPTSFFDFQS